MASPGPGISAQDRSAEGAQHQFEAEQEGFKKGLTPRQLQMIAIGGSIGTGLFLGTGRSLSDAGPSLFVLYAIAGFFGYLILRQLGELVVHRPSSGSFVSYCREFYGERAAYFTGWMYWISWATTTVADATALAVYIRWFGAYVPFLGEIPQWLLAFVVIVLVTVMNLMSVKVFGELEFWFALVKVGALVTFMIVGIIVVIFGSPSGDPTGFQLISESGGLLPHGLLPALVVSQGVVFAYSGIELVGTASGETQEPERVIPRAINSVILRIGIFYVGSVLLLCVLLPFTRYSGDESPFVTFFGSIGVNYAAPIMQLVVITAALSSLNAGLYSTGRIVHSMAMAGSAPRRAQQLTKGGVPFVGILLTTGVGMIGVVLNYVVPDEAFQIVLNISAICIIVGWAAITLPHQRFVALAKRGEQKRPEYRAPLAPFTNWITLAFYAAVLILVALDYPLGTMTLASMIVVIPLLVIGWRVVRPRVLEIAAAREGITGSFPVVAQWPTPEHRNRPFDHSRSNTIIRLDEDEDPDAEEDPDAGQPRDADQAPDAAQDPDADQDPDAAQARDDEGEHGA